MKKIIYCLVAALALVACTPKNGADQVVRIGVSLDNNAQPNQKGQQRISAIDKGSVIEILWEDKDVLYYQLDGENIDKANPFKLISGAGTKNAFFECENTPEENLFKQKFTLYYNGAGTPGGEIPKEQNGKANEVNHNYLFYTAHNCTIESDINLEPNFALLGIRLVKNGDKEITSFKKSISIGKEYISPDHGTVTEGPDAYILQNIGDVVNLEEKAPVFYFVLPIGYNLDDKYVRIIRNKGQHSSEPLKLPNYTLSSNEAAIITINIARTNTPEDGNGAYIISKP